MQAENEVYKNIDRRMKHKNLKLNTLKLCNEKYKFKYKYFSELVCELYKTGLSLRKVGTIVDLTPSAVAHVLKLSSVNRRSRGGSNRSLKLSKKTIDMIRNEKGSYVNIGRKYGISYTTVNRIKRKKDRWIK